MMTSPREPEAEESVVFEPLPEAGAGKWRQCAVLVYAEETVVEASDSGEVGEPVGKGGESGPQPVYQAYLGEDSGPERSAVGGVVPFQELVLELGHVHIGGTFGFAALALKAEVKGIVEALADHGVVGEGAGEGSAQQICAPSG